MTQVPGLVIAGTHSGCGKTTVSSGIMAALVKRGLKVQPFKVGPDFIDPSHHTRICGRPSCNLDPFMMGETGVQDTFASASQDSDIAIVEGVMGMYDGIDGSDVSSTAHVARLLGAPVVLVVDVKGMSRSVNALIKGFTEFDPSIKIAGIIFNRVGSPRHADMIKESLHVPALGWIPRQDNLAVQSRHLGLVMAHESGSMQAFGTIIEETCDLDSIISVAGTTPGGFSQHHENLSLKSDEKKPSRAKIGVAFDEAFCFYYEDNLDRLRSSGAELIFFSPVNGDLPDVDALYLGGGYPELHLPALESSACTRQISKVVDDGMPVYAECGGLIYLTRQITTDRIYHLCGILPGVTEMTKRIQALNYVHGNCVSQSSFLPGGLAIRGHEFHYSRIETDRDARFAFELLRGKGIESGKDGLYSGNAIGSYTHSYFSQKFTSAFVDAAAHFASR